MNNKRSEQRIPLFRIGRVKETSKTLPEGLILITSYPVNPKSNLPENSYALKIEDSSMEPLLKPGNIAIFSKSEININAFEKVYLFGIRGQIPLVRKIIKDDEKNFGKENADISNKNYNVKPNRKSFMTPTPLHIPKSYVSPIPNSSHEMIFLKGLQEGASLEIFSSKDLLWKHPLICVY